MAIGTLAELLSPATEAQFTQKLHCRELALWRGGDPARLTSLLDWAALMAALEGGSFPANRLRMTREGTPIHEAFFTQHGAIDGARILKLMEEGASMILQPFDGASPAVDALVAQIQSGTSDRVESGVIISTGGGGALRQHYDPDDLLIVQLEGSKRWFLHETPVRHPVRKMPPAAKAPPAGRIIEQTLEPGDLLLVPAGYWHRCENVAGRSIHLGLFFVPLSLTTAAERVWRRLLSDEDARAPLARGGPAPTAADVRSKLIEAISGMSTDDFFGRGD